ncbi:DUF3786 domain-containing protein [Desulfosoma caldarium]|uniref:Putative Fe-S cluster protein n=1 Tax=Desulfosoma caldarium TaxID=610254 RepID=A0A3N1VUQ1_9BACT|nr:DUF3786 domain-containing protein [Desulfosoma caldarium]ROR03507.1 putative Fe-S cluster protein [Desulfosoma caldarium]
MQEKRELLKNRLVPLDIYKVTPKTNCGQCSYPTCLAFATQAVVGEVALAGCPHLDDEVRREFEDRLARQLDQGIGRKRESFEKTLEFLRESLTPWLSPENAAALGASWILKAEGNPSLRFPYLDDEVVVNEDDVHSAKGRDLSPWEKIFLYNYVIGGAVEPLGRWVGMESLPNAVSKIKSLRAHCEEPLAKAFPQDLQLLRHCVAPFFEELPTDMGHAGWAGECRLLPKVRLRLLWWPGDDDEGFAPRVKFLFDARVLETLDLESLVFACEQITERVLEARRRVLSRNGTRAS